MIGQTINQQYDDLFIVILKKEEKPRLLRLHYGEFTLQLQSAAAGAGAKYRP